MNALGGVRWERSSGSPLGPALEALGSTRGQAREPVLGRDAGSTTRQAGVQRAASGLLLGGSGDARRCAGAELGGSRWEFSTRRRCAGICTKEKALVLGVLVSTLVAVVEAPS
jgi:hypothetical protein